MTHGPVTLEQVRVLAGGRPRDPNGTSRENSIEAAGCDGDTREP